MISIFPQCCWCFSNPQTKGLARGREEYSTTLMVPIPSRELTYPTLGKGKSSSKCHFGGYVSSLEGNICSNFFAIYKFETPGLEAQTEYPRRSYHIDTRKDDLKKVSPASDIDMLHFRMGHYRFPLELHPRKLTWHWKKNIFNEKYIFKWWLLLSW